MGAGTRATLGFTAAAVLLAASALAGCSAASPDSSVGTTGETTPARTSSTTAAPTSPAATTESVAPRTDLPPTLSGTDWERIQTTEKVVALTFDGGGSDAGVESVLATLAAAQDRQRSS